MSKYLILAALVFVVIVGLCRAEMPSGRAYTNSIGMKFVRIEAGAFRMGQLNKLLPWEIMPVSGDSGMTWSKALLVPAAHDKRHVPGMRQFRLDDGAIVGIIEGRGGEGL